MVSSPWSPINHWWSSVNTWKCKTFIQAFGGKSLCLSPASATQTCINIDNAISIIEKQRYVFTYTFGICYSGICHFPSWYMPLSILVHATFHYGIWHFPLWLLWRVWYMPFCHMPLSTLVYTTFHFGICHFPLWYMPLSILAYATFHSGICHCQRCHIPIIYSKYT